MRLLRLLRRSKYRIELARQDVYDDAGGRVHVWFASVSTPDGALLEVVDRPTCEESLWWAKAVCEEHAEMQAGPSEPEVIKFAPLVGPGEYPRRRVPPSPSPAVVSVDRATGVETSTTRDPEDAA